MLAARAVCLAPFALLGCLSSPTAVGALCAATEAPSGCDALLPLESPPVLDGVLDCPAAFDPTPLLWAFQAARRPPEVSARWAWAYRPDGVYVFAEVTKPALQVSPSVLAPWCGDAVHVYVDSDGVTADPARYDAVGTRQFICMAPAAGEVERSQCLYFSASSAVPMTRSSPLDGGRMRTFRTDGGYRFEGFLGADELGLSQWSLAAGQRVGVQMSISIGGASGPDPACPGRLGEFFLRFGGDGGATSDNTPQNVSGAFCYPRLDPESERQLKVGCSSASTRSGGALSLLVIGLALSRRLRR
jgi:hypothetical protein